MGSIWGAVVAGLLLTQVQALASLVISPVWTDPIVFGVMVLFPMFRPRAVRTPRPCMTASPWRCAPATC